MGYTKWELVELDKNFWQVQSLSGQIIGIFRKDLLPIARLVASAPEQNEALREIDRWLLDNPDVSDDPQLHIITIHIQDALAKAKG